MKKYKVQIKEIITLMHEVTITVDEVVSPLTKLEREIESIINSKGYEFEDMMDAARKIKGVVNLDYEMDSDGGSPDFEWYDTEEI